MKSRDELFSFGSFLFEWDGNKAVSNLRKHRISFAEGATVFGDDRALLVGDPDHSEDESRFLLIGTSRARKILVVVSVDRGERIRIISARKAERKEREQYEEGSKP